jgi:hypothetical protein
MIALESRRGTTSRGAAPAQYDSAPTVPSLTPYPPVEEPPRSSAALDAALATGVDMLRAQMPKVEKSLAAGVAAGRQFMRRNAPRLKSAAAQAGERAAPLMVRMTAYLRAHRRRVAALALAAAALSVGTYYALHFAIMHHSRCPAGVMTSGPDGDSAQSTSASFSVLVDRVKPRWTGSDLDVYYDVCGMPRGDFKTRVTAAREASGLQRLLGGTVQPVVAIWDETADKPAIRRHRTLEFSDMPAGTYRLQVVVTDARGRRRDADTEFEVVER